MSCELDEILSRAEASPRSLSVGELARLIDLRDADARQALASAALRVRRRNCGARVSLRGLVEIGNVCAKDCLYCGIRKSNANLARYQLDVDEIVRTAEAIARLDYGSIVLQGGEVASEAQTRRIETVLRRIAGLGLGVTLSLGEQTDEVYRRWREAGAARYLLRIETSNPDLYARIHPAGHSWSRRVACLRALRACGYQVGTGVMSALPGQTPEDLARDIVFFGAEDVDMIGMGPYIPHPDTPLGVAAPPCPADERLRLGLNMIAATRLYLHDVNIAATTALQALATDGRERGLACGANVIMPNATETSYRSRYRLYAGKPERDETAAAARADLERRIRALGDAVNYGQHGDSAHFFRRVGLTANGHF